MQICNRSCDWWVFGLNKFGRFDELMKDLNGYDANINPMLIRTGKLYFNSLSVQLFKPLPLRYAF